MTERERIIERLRNVDLGGGSHESLSALAKAVYEPVGGWTIGACEQLRQTLVRLLGGDAAQDECITDELPDLLRKAAKGGYEGSKGDVIDNIAQLIGCKSTMTFFVIDALADKVEQALRETYAKGHLSGFDEAERWHTEHGDWLGEDTHTPPSDGRRITDELRKYIRDAARWGISPTCEKGLADIADRIDTEHKNICYDYQREFKEWEHTQDTCYIELPKDADGEYIHIGDVVTMELMFGGMSKPLVVDRMELSHGKDGYLWCVALDTDETCWNQPSLLHHHAPTVEDVLREFAEGLGVPVADSYIATSAAKLRLAGGDAE